MAAEREVTGLIERVMASTSRSEAAETVAAHLILLTPAVDKTLAYLIDAATRDDDVERLARLHATDDLLRWGRQVGPRVFVSAMREEGPADDEGTAFNEFVQLHKVTGEPAFIDAALEAGERMLGWTAPGNPFRAQMLTSVSSVRTMRARELERPELRQTELRRAIEEATEALELTEGTGPDRAVRLSHLATALADAGEVDAAIDRLRDGVDTAGEDPMSQALCLTNLGSLLAARAQLEHDLADVGAAVASAERAVALTPDPSVERKERQSLLGHALFLRAEWTGSASDRDAAIDAHRAASASGSESGPISGEGLFELGCALLERLEAHKSAGERDEAFYTLGRAYAAGVDAALPALERLRPLTVDVVPVESLDDLTGGVLSLLREVRSAGDRFDRTGDPAALEYAMRGIDAVRMDPALTLSSKVNPWLLDSAGQTHLRRFRITSARHDVDAAVECLDEAYRRAQPDDERGSTYFRHLGEALAERSSAIGNETDRERAAEILERVCESTSGAERAALRITLNTLRDAGASFDDIPEMENELVSDGLDATTRRLLLLLLSSRLRDRYQARRDPDDLDRAIELVRTAIAEVPGDDVPSYGHLAELLSERFDLRGDVEDRAVAIAAYERAIDAASSPRDRAFWLQRLGQTRRAVYTLSGRAIDRERAIDVLSQAWEQTPRGAPEWPLRRALVLAMVPAVEMTDDEVALLDAAVSEADARGAHADPVLVSSLASIHEARFDANGQPPDLDRAIELAEQLVDSWSAPDDRANARERVARLLEGRWSASGALEDLRAAVDASERALAELSDSATSWPRMLVRLGDRLLKLYELTQNEPDRHRAVESFTNACSAGLETNALAVLSAASRLALHLAVRGDTAAAADAYMIGARALDLLLIDEPLRREKQDRLAATTEFARAAAFGLVMAGREDEAVSVLERTCALTLIEVLDRERVNLERLRKGGHADIADRYTEAESRVRALERDELEIVPIGAASGPARSHRSDAITAARRGLAVAIEQVRTAAGFEDFRLLLDAPPRPEHGDKVAYILPGPAGGLILLVGPEATRVATAPALNDTDLALAQERYLSGAVRRFEHPADWYAALDDVTAWLWDAVIAPLIDALGPGSEAHLPAVSLIPFGPLVALPIHASWTADPAASSGRRYAIDAMRIRYVPSARVFAEANRRAGEITTHRLLAVENPSPTSASALPAATLEASYAESLFPGATILRGAEATIDAVRHHLPQHSVLHFACHGRAMLDDPLESFVLLGHDARLTVRELMHQRFTARLAVLSACETAVIGTQLPNEVVGLPAAMVQCGVAGVIGSMWALPDVSAALLTTRFYELWTQGKQPSEALRCSQQWVRDSSNGEKADRYPDLMRDATSRISPSATRLWRSARGHRHAHQWAGFVYVGA